MDTIPEPSQDLLWVDDEDLSDEQIDQLLKQAELRLQGESMSTARKSAAQMLPKSAKLAIHNLPQPFVRMDKDIARLDNKRLLDEKHRQSASGIRRVEDPVALKRKKLEEKKATAGTNWLNLPRTNMTPQLKRDLQLLKMRSVLDPKRFYKKENSKSKPPEFSQVATMVEGPADFFSGRLTNRERKRTFVEEILAGEKSTGRLGKKYLEIQAAKTSGKKAHYKALMARRNKNNLRS